MGNQGFCSPEPHTGDAPAKPVHPCHFPMYVVKVADFLQMDGPPEAHHALLRKGLLHQWQPGLFVIFVSHQWLGRSHPDPDGQHASILRRSLEGMIHGTLQAEFEIEDEAPRRRRLLEPSSIGQGYLFLDWFAIPQITARAEGVNEEATKTDAARAVQSIPFYVEVSDVLLALVPELVHTETGQYCNYTSWFSRSWCRAELWCHVLSNKRDKSVLVVHSTLEAKFMQSWDWQNNIVVDGEFTVESDRAVVGSLGRRAIESKIAHLSEEGPLEVYRYFLARKAAMLGQASKAWDMNGFLERFKFPSMELAVRDTSSMNAVMCAVMSGDVMMLRLLATYAADLNFTIYGLNSLGFRDSFTVLMAAVKSNQPASLVASLIHLRADVSRRADIGDNAACHVKRPEHVQVLLQARADFHTAHEPFCFTPLAQAAGMTSAPTLKALLLARCDPNPSQSGLGITPLIGLIRFARGSPHALESAALLLEYRADINARAAPGGAFAWVALQARARSALVGLESSAQSTRQWAGLPGATPLGMAASIGNEALLNLLLQKGATMATNDRGDSPEDLARASGHFHLLPSLQTFFV